MENEKPFICNAVIKEAVITTSNYGVLDCWLMLTYGTTSQGFGGWVLYVPKAFTHHKLESVAGHHIFRCMEIAGVEKWSDIVGKTIRVKKNGGEWGTIAAIGHIVSDDWYCPADDFAKLK